MNTNKENDIIEESKKFTLRCFIVLITTIYFFLAYKIISKKINFLINKYNFNNLFSNIFGETNLLNTLFVMILLYFIYYVAKKILSYIFKENFDIKNLTDFFINSF